MNIKLMAAFAAFLTAVTLGNPAQAKHRYHRHHVSQVQSSGCQFDNNGHSVCDGVQSVEYSGDRSQRKRRYSENYNDGRIVAHPSGCPHTAFCGCGVSVKVFGHPVRNLFLAANWLKYPRANPAPGMVAARHGHVMYIEAIDANGNAVVYDPNSGGHQTRVHTRSLAGYRVVNPHGA